MTNPTETISPDHNRTPIAIGGLGGSGTRVFAASLQYAGFAIGSTLNDPLDNLWFTILFKRRAWSHDVPDLADIAISVDLFQRAMTTGLAGNMTDKEADLLDSLASDLVPKGPWKCGVQAGKVDSLITSGPQTGGHGQPWGWKEPNTHLFLPQLNEQINGLRYIHVVRDGLDMSFSNNTWQADHWAHHFGLKRPNRRSDPVQQLRYWIAANRRAIDYGQRHMAGRFMVMDYDGLCAHPDMHWPRLQRFLGKPSDTPIPDGFIATTSIGRSKSEDLSIFPNDLLAACGALQKEVDGLAQVEI
ncbi:MAG: sulfotransferase [bacterium]|nr:sulfotransferase [bacterium]